MAGAIPRIVVESLFKPQTTGDFQLLAGGGGAVQGDVPLANTRSPQFQRMRLFPKPHKDMTIGILGKMACVDLVFDQQEPLIKCIEQCLMSFATAAMWDRARQAGKAAQHKQLAGTLLAEAIKLHAIQEANNQRLVPEDGFWDPYFGADRHGAFFTGGYCK